MDPLRQTAAVLGMLLLLAACLWLLRRRGGLAPPARAGRGGAKPIERLGRLALSPQHAVELVRIGPRVLVLALHGSGCSLLGAMEAGELEAAASGARPAGRLEA